ncbi:MAG: response regulator [Candidatus Abyssobacteria bacterium SURF_17]|uniref:Response regulator n=1 Tax=Candidatus Abyssobacteria bacterium SURF_17 TaxID=2093361 RepID=A0A419END8_9BACT|nr:MAG: response regulator [Candidatus Abyssubacteria bacterium SURF_17]
MTEPARVLVVEDNVMNLELAVDLLKLKGYDVLTAKTGPEALEISDRERLDLILMDVQLPGMDGLAVTKKLKENPKTRNIPVVALTAHAMKGDEERILRHGCSGYISKPINTREFPKAVERFIEQTRKG